MYKPAAHSYKKIFLFLPVACLLFSFAPQGRKARARSVQQPAAAGIQDYRQLSAPLPPLRIITSKGNAWTNDSLAGNGNLFVMFFNPTCDHCEAMTDALIADSALLKSTRVVLVAGANMGPYLGDFLHHHNRLAGAGMQVAIDSAQLIEKVYNYQNLPQINVYGTDRRLLRVLSGITTTDSLRQYMQ